MAKIVLGIASSHSPMMSLSPELWHDMGERDKSNAMLSAPPDGKVWTYEELLERADPTISKHLTLENFRSQADAIQKSLATLATTLTEAKPDVVVVVGDDQEEFFFDDNMPSLAIYWGESIHLIPRAYGESASASAKASAWGYGDVEMDVPVNAELGLHLIQSLVEADFDVTQCRYQKETYGGHVGGSGYMPNFDRTTPPRRQGLPHAYSFVVKRFMDNKPVPIVPVIQNTFYPPNQVTPRRCYSLGNALREAIEAWDSNTRVAVVASGGLSHFVVDEEGDWMALDAMKNKDAQALRDLPKHRYYSGNSETLNWVTLAGAVEHLDMELLDYVPVYRSAAGTGGGWGFARWM